ncbi:hypothetical protein GCM10008986_26950 [Salinibacillus aidingensis]|uniref:ABC-2 type transporter transmembrane domain-containing protein n=1 Tax=Salinibacillus aidingensis TaxID=237684 RepID=A0ABN1BJC4_9BACI
MLFAFMKKQLLLMIRDRTNFTLLLVMPIILVFIINFAIGDLMTEDTPEIDAKVAIVEHTSEESQLNQIKEEINEMSIPEDARNDMVQGITEFQPIQILKQDVLGGPKHQEMVDVKEIGVEEMNTAKVNKQYAAIIEVPENFSYRLVKSIFLGEGEPPELSLYVNQEEELAGQVIEDLLVAYQEQLQTSTILEQNGLGELRITSQDVKGETVAISGMNPITNTTYYVVGMSVMFVLYIASTMGAYAYEEKRDHLFNRILIANVSRWVYFLSIFISSSFTGFIQLMILFSVSVTIFDVTLPNFPSFLATSILLSFSVGGIASLLTSINYRLNSDQASAIFGSAIVTLFAFFGGSFFPIGGDVINTLGKLTPNGSGLTAFLSAFQGYGMEDISGYLFYLGGLTLVTLVMAVVIFPKRGKAV